MANLIKLTKGKIVAYSAVYTYGKVATKALLLKMSEEKPDYKRAYGTAAFLEHLVDENHSRTITVCKTKDGKCQWLRKVLESSGKTTIEIVKGSKATIKKLETKETEHFETVVIWK